MPGGHPRHTQLIHGPDERAKVAGFRAIILERRDGRVVDGGGLENVVDRLCQDGYISPPNFTPTCANYGRLRAIWPIFQSKVITERAIVAVKLLI
jgi:hypothetical protein